MRCAIALVLSFATTYASPSLVQRVAGEVAAGNYSYYKLTSSGRMLLVLTTLSGDADMYLSSRTTMPTFSLDNHEMQSCTCGLDTIEIPAHQKRPVSIGVYGYPHYEISKYTLSVLLFPDDSDSDWSEQSYGGQAAQDATDSSKLKAHTAQKENESLLLRFIQLFFSIVSVLLEIVFEILL